MKKARGITLIALVITIVVLLILAAVTINLTLGERGIFNTAQLAAKNYTDAAEKEETNLNNFQNEINNTLKDLESGVVTKPEEQKWEDITAANYGDYVNYEDGLDLGSSTYGHKTDWRIFYKDDDGYVYLISSYYLPYAQMPAIVDKLGYEGRPYSVWWKDDEAYTYPFNYESCKRFGLNYEVSYISGGFNGRRAVLAGIVYTPVWKKFVNTEYAEEAIGAPSLEMWVNSWNERGNQRLYYNINKDGYVLSKDGLGYNNTLQELMTEDDLFFPVTEATASDGTGRNYYLAGMANYDVQFVRCDR